MTAWPCWAHRCGGNEVLATQVGAMAEQALERFSEHVRLLDGTPGRLQAPREKASGPPMPGTAPTLHR